MKKVREYPDIVQTILARPMNGSGGGIPLTRGEVAMLLMDGYAGDGPGLLDIRSQGYGEDDDWDGLTHDDIFSCDEGLDAAFVWSKWEPLELWPDVKPISHDDLRALFKSANLAAPD
ncbi:MAG: hypothetical protein JO053_15300 [Acidobacteria bacterium]|nr:hypothetical protein [Acidobacteriota bacterium]